jgi:hypothetical protein
LGRWWYILNRVRRSIALIRKGEIDFGPGDQCTYCPLGGLQSCIPTAETVLGFKPDSNLISLV